MHPGSRGRASLWLTAVVASLVMVTGMVSAVSASAAPATGKTLPGGQYAAEIQRTEYGIPHILAHDFGGLGYGYGYAFAQDNLCVMADRVVTLRGERSRYFGPKAMTDNPLVPQIPNLASDVYYRSVDQSGTVKRLLAQRAPLGPTAQVRRLVDGYVAGYNRYLKKTGVAHLPDPTCRAKAWVGPITATDVWAGVLDVDRVAGTSGFAGDIGTATPPAAGAAVKSAVPVARGRSSELGSNGWALGRDATVGHDGMLLANPHYPWQGLGRFYQIQLTIPGVMNVSGASLYGTPVVEIGHTQSLAWTHTVSTAQRFTLYQLALVPGHPTSYLVNGRPVPMTRQTVTVPGSGVKAATLYTSKYGPVLATGWTNTTAFAVDDANADNLRSMNEWLAMDRSQNLAQLHAAQKTYQAIPFTYTMATDSSGTASFADAGVVPNVTNAEATRCIDTPQGKSAYPYTYILDGSKSTCGWGNDRDAIVPGIFGPSHYPQLTRTDYVTNDNDSPWLTNPKAPITGYPAIFGDTGTERSLRTRLGLNMIAQRLAGTDGLGRPGFTVPTLQATMLGDRDNSAELGRSDILTLCRAHPTLPATDRKQVDLTTACGVLSHWNARTNVDSRGAVLWREIVTDIEQIATTPDSWWTVPFNPAKPLTTPRGLNGNDPDVRHALANAVQFFQVHHIPLDITLGSAQRQGSIPLHGCGSYEGCFNVITTANPFLGSNGTYPEVVHGSSFIMAVELTPKGPISRTILTYSESTNPTSPHSTDQTVLYSHKQWVTERFTQAQINADPHLQTTVLTG